MKNDFLDLFIFAIREDSIDMMNSIIYGKAKELNVRSLWSSTLEKDINKACLFLVSESVDTSIENLLQRIDQELLKIRLQHEDKIIVPYYTDSFVGEYRSWVSRYSEQITFTHEDYSSEWQNQDMILFFRYIISALRDKSISSFCIELDKSRIFDYEQQQLIISSAIDKLLKLFINSIEKQHLLVEYYDMENQSYITVQNQDLLKTYQLKTLGG